MRVLHVWACPCSAWAGVCQNGGMAAPEPFASMVDVLTAAQAVERAIHAPSALVAAAALTQARAQVLHAAGYLQLAGLEALRRQALDLAADLVVLRAGLPRRGLAAYQNGPIYAFQGKLAALYGGLAGMV
jgi:hypothetical protein